MIKQKVNHVEIEKPKRLGIVGGLGPETSCKFTLNLDRKIKSKSGRQPDISIEMVPVSLEMEKGIIEGDFSNEFLGLMSIAVKRLEKLNVNFIVIPCNSVHVFINDLRNNTKSNILSIIEETAKKCKTSGFKKIGILGSSTTINEQLHDKELTKLGIEPITPNEIDQTIVNNFIKKILAGENFSRELNKISRVIKNLKNNGAEAIILGCTELSNIQERDSVLPLIDTLTVLENVIVEKMLGVENGK